MNIYLEIGYQDSLQSALAWRRYAFVCDTNLAIRIFLFGALLNDVPE